MRCWVEIDRAALRHNARVARERSGASVLAVIKANGYGHGLAAVAQALAEEVELFGVANLQEALEARAAVRARPVMILGPALAEERAGIVEQGFIPSISSLAEAKAFAQCGAVSVNCAIDTGMGRMGLAATAALEQVQAIAALPKVTIHSVSTHLAAADEDAVFTRAQLAHFAEVVQQLRAAVPGGYRIHALPSAGVLGFGGHAFDLVRAGLMLYGVAPQPELQETLQPALTWKARVVLLRELPAGSTVSYGHTWTAERPTRVATLGVGYADGYPRAVSSRGAAVLLGGRRCPVLGRVTMDLLMVDVTDAAEVSLGDEAVLLGEGLPARELADRADTIPWEIFTGIGSRVARVYL